MIVVDTNLLIYAYNSGSTHHAKARQWLEHTLSGSESVGLPWQSTAAFVRIMTDVRLPAEHLTALAAVEVVNGWLDQAIVRPLTPGEGRLEFVSPDGARWAGSRKPGQRRTDCCADD